MTTSQPELVYGIFCETVRVEASGQITPIGIWGDTCRLSMNAPTFLPLLAFHVYVRNLGHKTHHFKLHMTFPGSQAPFDVEVPMVGNGIQTSQNLNFNMTGVQITAPGDVVASVHIDTNPPIDREFRLRLEFHQSAALPPVVH